MSYAVPYTTRPDDVTRLLEALPSVALPEGEIKAGYFKSLGFSLASGRYLLEILKQLGFIEENGYPGAVWVEYASAANKGMVLASAIKKVYPRLFEQHLCPYLDDDETILDYLKNNIEATPRELELMLQTFRNLIEPADFQEQLIDKGAGLEAPFTLPEGSVKVDPSLQFNIQVHIDAGTPDEKIETIFKHMRKYLLGKTD